MSTLRKFLVPSLMALSLPLLPMVAQDQVKAADRVGPFGLTVAPRQFREDGAAPRGRITRSGTSLPAIKVQIRSTDARVVVPESVTFAEGERQLFFPIRLVNDSIINDGGSRDGYHNFQIQIGGPTIVDALIDLKILDDEPFRAPVTSNVTLSRFEVVDGSMNTVRLVFSGPVSFNPSRYGKPLYGFGVNGLQTRVAKLQVINPQVLLITLDRDFEIGDTLSVAAYNLTDARGLPLRDQIRVVRVPAGPLFGVEVSKAVFREDAGPNASRGTINVVYPSSKPITFSLRLSSPFPNAQPVKAHVPASVVLPAGATSVSFPIAAIDNSAVDGDLPTLLYVSAPYTSAPVVPNTFLIVQDDEPAPVSGVRILSFERRGQGVVRLKLSGSVRTPFSIGPLRESFRISVGGRTFVASDLSLDASGSVLDVLTGSPLADTQAVTITILGLRDSSLAVIPNTSVTLPAVPSVPAA